MMDQGAFKYFDWIGYTVRFISNSSINLFFVLMCCYPSCPYIAKPEDVGAFVLSALSSKKPKARYLAAHGVMKALFYFNINSPEWMGDAIMTHV